MQKKTPLNTVNAVDMGALAQSRLFRGVALESVEGLLGACAVRALQPDEHLIRPGENNTNIYLLLSGRLRIHLDSPDNKPITVLEAGESVGELSIIEHKPTSAYVTADRPSRLLVAAEDIFWSLIHASHRIATNMLIILAERLRNDNTTILNSLTLQEEYRRRATVDELTGIFNRRWFEEAMSRQLARCERNGSPLSLIMIDIDHFKKINDGFGHPVGDHVLYSVAQTMLRHIRPSDLIARYGGEEFAVILADTDLGSARLVAERLRKVVSTLDAGTTPHDLPAVTVSLGLAVHHAGETAQALIASADAALYRAKNGGRNRVAD